MKVIRNAVVTLLIAWIVVSVGSVVLEKAVRHSVRQRALSDPEYAFSSPAQRMMTAAPPSPCSGGYTPEDWNKTVSREHWTVDTRSPRHYKPVTDANGDLVGYLDLEWKPNCYCLNNYPDPNDPAPNDPSLRSERPESPVGFLDGAFQERRRGKYIEVVCSYISNNSKYPIKGVTVRCNYYSGQRTATATKVRESRLEPWQTLRFPADLAILLPGEAGSLGSNLECGFESAEWDDRTELDLAKGEMARILERAAEKRDNCVDRPTKPEDKWNCIKQLLTVAKLYELDRFDLNASRPYVAVLDAWLEELAAIRPEALAKMKDVPHGSRWKPVSIPK